MKEAIVHAGPRVEITTVPVPVPGPGQVLIKIAVTGTNPKDWKVPEWIADMVVDQGDDMAGTVAAVGEGVSGEFREGDRVAAFHQMLSPHGSYAEYGVAWAASTWHVPEGMSFEEAATLPLASMTAAIGLFLKLGLPTPFSPPAALAAAGSTPLIVYGAASAVGSYAVQLARRAGIHPLICVAGKGAAHVEALIDRSRGDAIVDYRVDESAAKDEEEKGKVVQQRLRDALAGKECRHAFDAVSDHGSYVNLGQVLAKTTPAAKATATGDDRSKMTLVLPGKEYVGIPDWVEQSITSVGAVHAADDAASRDFGFVWFRYMARGLAEGWLKPHPHEVVPGGLGGVETALRNLKEGKASAIKYVLRIGETEGL